MRKPKAGKRRKKGRLARAKMRVKNRHTGQAVETLPPLRKVWKLLKP